MPHHQHAECTHGKHGHPGGNYSGSGNLNIDVNINTATDAG